MLTFAVLLITTLGGWTLILLLGLYLHRTSIFNLLLLVEFLLVSILCSTTALFYAACPLPVVSVFLLFSFMVVSAVTGLAVFVSSLLESSIGETASTHLLSF